MRGGGLPRQLPIEARADDADLGILVALLFLGVSLSAMGSLSVVWSLQALRATERAQHRAFVGTDGVKAAKSVAGKEPDRNPQ
jgi:hypothetical protein